MTSTALITHTVAGTEPLCGPHGASPSGCWRDVIRDAAGAVTWDSGVRPNAIANDFRRLLAAFAGGAVPAIGIQGLWLGQGLAAWDAAPPPQPDGSETALADPAPFLVGTGGITFTFLSGNTPSAQATNRLQVEVVVGPSMPPWPDANHPSTTLREFGLVGRLDGSAILINHVRHPAIAKDPASTLERTIWLLF